MKSIALNFGPSPHKVMPYSPPEPDQVIEVPIEDELPIIFLGRLKDLVINIGRQTIIPEKTRESFEAVVIDFLKEGSADINKQVFLLWIPERHEWIGIEYSRWQEKSDSDDELYQGPYSLDDFCEDKLALAYNFSPEKYHRGLLRKSSPHDLHEYWLNRWKVPFSTQSELAIVGPEHEQEDRIIRLHSQQPSHIFISYVHEDHKQVMKLYDDLIKRGYKFSLTRNHLYQEPIGE